MEEKLRTLHELCDTISRELSEANEKIRKAGGKLSPGDVDYLDKLTHMLKSTKTTIAMMEAEEEEDGGYSGRYMPRMGTYYDDRTGRTYAGGMSRNDGYGGVSRAGRQNAKRDSMGRYTREGGYSYADSMEDLLDEMRGMMNSLPEEKRREVQRFVDKMDRM